jgi:hypothetical protein
MIQGNTSNQLREKLDRKTFIVFLFGSMDLSKEIKRLQRKEKKWPQKN